MSSFSLTIPVRRTTGGSVYSNFSAPPPLRYHGRSQLNSRSFSVSGFRVLAKQSSGASDDQLPVIQRPDSKGFFGIYGGNHSPDNMLPALSELESAYKRLSADPDFQKELDDTLRDLVGRPTQLYYAEKLTEYYKRSNGEGPQIYLKREDHNPTRSHKINNCVAQVLLARKLGKTRIIAESGSGHHGVATAFVCEKFGLKCDIYMGRSDIGHFTEEPAMKAQIMKKHGANVILGVGTVADSISHCFRDWRANYENTHYIMGSVLGPHPYPLMVRDFQTVMGKEIREQAMHMWGGKPDVLLAYVGGGSHAIGMFHEFLDDQDVRLIGVQVADRYKHQHRGNFWKELSTLKDGEPAVLHGALTYVLKDDDGNLIHDCLPVDPGLNYPGVGPEHCFLKDIGRVEYHGTLHADAWDAHGRVLFEEKIGPSIGTSHALAYLNKLCPTLANDTKVVIGWNGYLCADVEED